MRIYPQEIGKRRNERRVKTHREENENIWHWRSNMRGKMSQRQSWKKYMAKQIPCHGKKDTLQIQESQWIPSNIFFNPHL